MPSYATPTPRPDSGEAPLSAAQRAILNTIPLSVNATLAWNEARAIRFRGRLSREALLASVRDLVEQNDALRTRINGSRMTAGIASPFSVEQLDLSLFAPSERHAKLDAALHSLVTDAFDLQRGPLFRAVLVNLAPDEHVLGLAAHHIICDGWSFGILIEDLVEQYHARTEPGASVPALKQSPSYLRFAGEDGSGDNALQRDTDLAYWVNIYSDNWPTLDLPVDGARAAQRSYTSQRQDVRLQKDLIARLKTTSGRHGASLFSILLASYAALVARLSGSSDVVVAIPAAAQLNEGVERLVGQCVTHLPVRLAVDVDAAASELLAVTQTAVLDAYEHKSCGLELLLERFSPPADQGRLPLACVKFNLNPSLDAALGGLKDLQANAWTPPRVAEHFEMFLNAEQDAEGMLLCCQYNSDLFHQGTVQRWLGLYRQILEGMAGQLDRPLAELLAPTPEDQHLLGQFNATAAPLDRHLRVEAMIDAQVLRTPEATAVIAGEETLTYAELHERACGVAAELQQRGVLAGDLVGLSCGRNQLMLVGLYGILKAGAGYVPLDPSFPVDRLDYMSTDAALKLVLCDESVADGWKPAQTPILMLDRVSPASRSPDVVGAHSEMPAYVIYTSGSTGQPKGVRVPHRSAVNLLQSVAREPGMGPDDVVLAVTTLSFDIAVSEVILPLTVGACIVVANRDETTDGSALRALIERQHVNFVDATPSTWRLLLAAGWSGNTALRAICTGEPLPPDLAATLIPRVAVLWNGYGPTETTVWSSFHRVTSPSVPIPIGRPVANTQFHVLDGRMRPLPVGVTGELWIGGDGVTLGYLNRPDLTAERFIVDPFSKAAGATLYKAGDLGRWRSDGILECLGRADHQVKVRGYRIELGEIEVQLCAHPAVARAVVITREDRPGDVRLVAYVVAAQAMPTVTSMREHLALHLPDYMIPQHFVPMAEIPLLPNGKINRHALPLPSAERPDLSVPYQAPVNDLEKGCCEIFASVLNLNQVGRHDNFFDLGGNSLLAMQVLDGLAKLTGRTLSAPTIFSHPDPAGLAQCLAPEDQQDAAGAAPTATRRARRDQQHDDPIAIIAMSGRFPGANSVEALWDNLLAGRDSITQFTLETLDPSVPAALRNDPNYVRARGVIDGVEMFDNAFFGISAREADITDPQHRLFLEICWECLERGGYAPDRVEQSVGVFAGVYTPTYLQRHVMAHPQAIERIGEFQVMVGNDKDYVATRVAHKLNLKGPAIAIHTACSTSLVAIAQAVDSLRLGRCDMALAGAASVTCPPHSGYLYQEGAMLSRDALTRTFDAGADGTAFNDGAAVVLLKRLSDALADGDQVFALIRGIATNNDGGGKASFTAPSVQGQAAVVAAAHEDAGIDPRTISYVEAHGTATPLGDPVEVEGLTRAFRRATPDTGFCRIGSVKSNIGHLITAAGATGMIKTALALCTEKLPATIHFEKPNPKIDFANSPFIVNSSLTPWPRMEQPRRAGVSSFGVGGTNAHAVLEEAPQASASAAAVGPQLLLLSAKTRTALDRMAAQLADQLDGQAGLNLADVAYTLRVGRSRFSHRMCVVGSTGAESVGALRSSDHPLRALRALGASVPALVWMFPGQGAQYSGMGRELYAQDAHFRAAFDECLEGLKGVLDFDLKERMFNGDASALVATATTQPATFVLEYALAKAWQAQGAKPQALVGHSVGEFVAAVLAGVMSLNDAVRLVARRGALMQSLPGGSMLSVRLSREKLLPLMPAGLSLAAENGPTACVVAGPSAELDAWRLHLEGQGVVARMLQTSHAFHSSMMDPAVQPFEAEVRKVRLSAPQIPIISTVSGSLMTASQATDPGYWARHLREPVRFSPALVSALAGTDVAFLEIGPRGTLSTLARQHTGAGKRTAIAVQSLADTPESETAQFLLAQGQLWTLGIDLPALSGQPVQGRRRVLLPTYPFERKRCWLDAATETTIAAPLQGLPAPVAPAPVLSTPIATPPAPAAAPIVQPPTPATMSTPSPQSTASAAPAARLPVLMARLRELFEDVAGVEISAADISVSFIELGLDSLSLTQAALQVKKSFSVTVTFRQLMEKYRSVETLAQFLDTQLPPEKVEPVAVPAAPAATAPSAALAATPNASISVAAAPVSPGAPVMLQPVALAPIAGNGNALHQLLQQQMQLMAQQLAVLSGQPLTALAAPSASAALASAAPAPSPQAQGPAPSVSAASVHAAAPAVEPQGGELVQPSIKSLVEKPFGASPRLTLQATQDFTAAQRQWLDDFIARYNTRSGKSKTFSQDHRKVMADPRVVTGFNPLWKDLVYPIVVDRSAGANLWDLDGNEYIDLLSCFGGNLLGYQPPDVIEAMNKQLQLGLEVGPQHPIAAEVAQLITEFTGMERVGFCNTGSEAVMGAMRIARTVTGRKTIAIFSNSYHGIFDEVVVRGTRQLRSLSAAPGILANAVENILVLDWNSEESLRILRERGPELAAIMTEPIQNKYPTIQPREFVQSLRQIADKAGCALIFDEVVTGFRVAPGGSQEFYGVRADITTYGKVIGGGLPFAAIAGNANWLDALDGGHWQYGDDSYPEAGVTYFAGTFVRHPLALAAARATLLHIKRGGREFYRKLNERTQRMIDRLNTAFAIRGAPVKAVHVGSIWRLQWDDNQKFVSLFYYLARYHGLHVYEQFGHFVTEAMTDVHTDRIIEVFTSAIDELMALGLIAPRDGSTPPDGSGGGGGGGVRDNPAKTGAPAATLSAAPLTPGQTERWLAGGFDASSRRALNESLCLALSGQVDLAALRLAVQDVLQRHETFRVRFDTDQPRQTLAPPGPIGLAEYDLRDQADANAALDQFGWAASERDFPYENAPLAAASLLLLSDGRVVVHLVASHLVLDGWASSVFIEELAACYRARALGNLPLLPAAESPLAFAAREQERMDEPDAAAALEFWKSTLRNPPAQLQLADQTPPVPRRYVADTVRASIESQRWDALRGASRQAGATLFQFLLTAVTVMLRRRSGQSEFVVSIPYASQGLDSHGPLMADGVMDLPLRLGCQSGEKGRAVLERVRSHLMDALEYPLVTQGTIARALGIRSVGDRPAFTSIYFNLNPKVDLSGFSPLQAEMHEGRKRGLLNELFFNFYEKENALSLDLHYSSEYYSPGRAQSLVDDLLEVVAQLCGNLDAPIAAAKPTAAAIDARLIQWNNTAREVPVGSRVEQWVLRQAAATPDAAALSAGGTTLTYRQLAARSARFAQLMRQRGIGHGALVGLCLGRGPDLLPALLGILQCGAGYVPLDPGFPPDRLKYMAKDADVQLVITESAHAALSGVARERQLRVDDDAALIAAASDMPLAADPSWPQDATAYVIYTSGSTGQPKGVVLPQRAVCNFLASMRHTPGLKRTDRLLAVTTLSFDIAVLELLLPLTVGAHVVLAQREEAMDGEVLGAMVHKHGITVMQATPTTWHVLLDAGWRAPAGLRALCGGEPLPPSLATRLLEQGIDLWNMYGPTETTVWSTLAKVVDPAIRKITIGGPIDNTQVWILDEALRPVPIGTEGEICVGGLGVATGYFKRPDLTADRFVSDPFSTIPGARLYRTGDLGRWLDDGMLEHLGRLDFQVKIRGYRIELGEIEARLAALPGVARTVVVAREDTPGDVRLVGYAVAEAGVTLDAGQLRESLRSGLPDYMLPQFIVALETMPLLPNGKIDRKALPAPVGAAPAPAGAYEAPANDIERSVASAMQTVLKVAAVGRKDDFFALGGHSLLAARLVGQLNRELGMQMGLRVLFESPTVVQLAQAIERQRVDALPPRPPILHRAVQDTAPMTLMQDRIHSIEQMVGGGVAYSALSCHRLVGAMNLPAFDRAFQEMLQRQASLRTCFVKGADGSYVQRVRSDLQYSLLPVHDLSAMPPSERDAELKKLLTGLAALTFDLEKGPLFRAQLFKLGEEEYALFFGCHHIVWDGWSFDILYTEMSGLYEAYAQGQTPTLPPLAVSYGDFAQWHNDWLKTSEIQQQFEFWKRHIGSATQLRVPAPDLPRRAGGNTRGGSEFMHISNERVEQIRELARRTGSTLSIVMLSVYSALVSQWLDEPTPAIGLPVRGRPNPELEAVMGFFNNMLPLRLHVDRSKSALAWIGEVRKSVTDAIANQDVPFEMLARETPGLLYQVMLTFQDARARPTHWGPLAHDRIPIMHEGATEDLNLWMVEITDGIEAGLQYNADAFLPDTARALRDRFLLALERLVTRPQQSLGELLQPADAELARLATWGTAPVTASATADIVDMAWQQLSTHPRSVAWQDGKRSLTRARLLGIVQKAQATLQARLTPGRDTIAVCCADPLAASIVALATLACNARILTLQSPLSNAASQALAERDDIAMLVTDTGPDIQGPAGLVQTNIADVAAVDAWHADAGRRNTDPVWGLDRGLLNALLANVQSLSPLSNRQAVWAVEGVATAGLVPWVMLAWAHGAAWVALNEADLSQGPHIKALAEKLAPRQIHAPARALRHLANLGATAKNAPCVWVDVGAASTALAQLGPEPGLRLVAYRSLPDLAIPVAAGLIEAGNFCNTFGKPLLGGLLSVVDATKQVVPVGVAGRLRWSDARYSVEDAATSVRWRSDGVLQYLSGPATDTPTADERSHNDAVVEAASDTESALLAIWRELLGRDEIGVTDNFFLVGGHSMLALRMMSEIHKRMGHQLPLSSLITASTVRQLAEHIDKPAPSDSVVLIRPGDSAEPPLFMVHDGDGETLLYRNLALRLTPGRAVYGLQPLSSDGLAMRHTRIADMAKHYADGIRKVQEHGPYFIGGLCAGGVIAFEVSRQLQEMGESVALTALLDIGDVQAPERRGREAGNRIKRFMKVFQNEEQAPLASHLRTSLTRATGKVRGYLSYAQDARTEESDVTQRAARLQECLDRQEVPDDDVKNLSVRQLYYFARAQHQPQGQLKGDVVLFRASNGDGTLADTPCIEMYAEPLFGWQQRVTGAVRTFDVPGGHSTMLQEPNVAVLASLMQEQIDRVASDAVESGDDTAQRRRAV